MKPQRVLQRRRREQKTNYSRRLRVLHGKTARLVVRTTNTKIIAQVIKFSPEGDKVAAGIDSTQLHQQGWPYSCKNYPAFYLTGFWIGKMALAKGYKEL